MESTRIKLERAPIEDMEEAMTEENGQQQGRPRITAPQEEGEQQQMDLDGGDQQGQVGMDEDSRLSLDDKVCIKRAYNFILRLQN